MKAPHSPYYAVLMGDIVGSEQHASPDELHSRFNAAIERQNMAYAEALASPLTITLGDEFQGLTTSLVLAAQMAREVRLDLMSDKVDCRFAIGVVKLKTPLNEDRAWNMMGSGLASARERLNEKRVNTLYRFDIPEHPAMETMLEASGAALTTVERSWTETQRHDIQALLKGASPAEVARHRDVSVHSIYKVRNSGNFDLYVLLWNAIYEALAYIDKSLSSREIPITLESART
jgi:hypothetical protein